MKTANEGTKLMRQIENFATSFFASIVSAALIAIFAFIWSTQVLQFQLVHALGGDITRWEHAIHGEIPTGAISAGTEANGQNLYICRARHEGGIHIGKVRQEFGSCNFPYGGKELKEGTYEVLVSVLGQPDR